MESALRAKAPDPELAPPAAQTPGQFSDVSIYMVATAVGVTSMSFNVWWPFLPLYALKLGASSDAEALFWLAAATTTQGIARLISGPVWGVISDRVGRRLCSCAPCSSRALWGRRQRSRRRRGC